MMGEARRGFDGRCATRSRFAALLPRGRRCVDGALLLCLWLGTPVAASGQTVGKAPPPACVEPRQPASVDDYFTAFQCAFDAGDYAGSLVALERACTLHESAECFFNLGLVHNTLYAHGADSAHCTLALDYYRRYLSSDPYGEARDDVLLASDELRQSCEPAPSEPAAPAAATSAAGEPPPPPASAPPVLATGPVRAPPRAPDVGVAPERSAAFDASSNALPLALLGAGAASGAAAVVAAAAAWRAQGDLEQRARASGDPERLTRTDNEAHHLVDSRERNQTLAWAFGLGSVALIGAGATLLLIDTDDASLSLGCGGLPGLTYAGGF